MNPVMKKSIALIRADNETSLSCFSETTMQLFFGFFPNPRQDTQVYPVAQAGELP
jgi:hypothetical protein